jgi:LCP family protein required for cell wall assembly
MAGGPGNGGRDDDYDWLYGKDGRRSGGRPPSGDDEHTRILPPGSSEPPPSARRPRSEHPREIAPEPGRGPSRRRRGGLRRPRFRLGMLKWLLLAWVVFLVAVPLWAYAGATKATYEPRGDRPEDDGGTNYLVVGSDARKGLSGRRTDTIMLLHTGKGPNVLMSIPRDSIVEIPGRGTGKINAAFAYGGPRLLTRTIEANTEIHVDDYVEIGFRGFVGLVDAVGGIQICPKQDIKDPLAELDVKAGCQEADGRTALGYSRTRKLFGLGDIERARNQREVVSAIGHEVLSWKTVVNPVRYYRVVTGGAKSVRLGEGTGPVALAQFALAMNRVNGKSGLTCGVPIADLAVNWDAERSERLFTLLRENRADEIGKRLCTPTGRPQ